MPWELRKPRAHLQGLQGGRLVHRGLARGAVERSRCLSQAHCMGASRLTTTWMPGWPRKGAQGIGHSTERLTFHPPPPQCPSVPLRFSPGTWYPLEVWPRGCL